jgi:hypothetical protein
MTVINPRELTLQELHALAEQTQDSLALELFRRYSRIIYAHDDAVRDAVEVLEISTDKQGSLL